MSIARFGYLRVGLVLSILALAVVAVFMFVAPRIGMPMVPGTTRFDGWGYSAGTESDGSTIAHVESDRATVADLHRYAATNKTIARELTTAGVTAFAATISFRKPLPIDEFVVWAGKSPIVVEAFQLRIIGTNGEKWTMGGAPRRGELIAASDLERNLSDMRTRGGTDVRGVIVVEGKVEASAYERVANDPAVFVADITRSAAREHIVKTMRGVNPSRISVILAPVYGRMEDLGLDNFR